MHLANDVRQSNPSPGKSREEQNMNIRETLNQPVLDLLAACGLITREQQNDILEVQARMLAVHRARNHMPFFARGETGPVAREDRNMLARLKAEMEWYAVDDAQLREARKSVVSKTGMPADVPPVGVIAVEMGLITAEAMEAYLLAQTGIALLDAAERFQTRHAGAAPGSMNVALIHDADAPDAPARAHIGKYEDNNALTGAQAALHMVELADCVVATHPELANDMRFDELRGTATALAVQVLTRAADLMAERGRLTDARDIHRALPPCNVRLTHARMIDMYDFVLYSIGPLKNHGLLEISRAEKMGRLIDERLRQIRGGVTLAEDKQGKAQGNAPEIGATDPQPENAADMAATV